MNKRLLKSLSFSLSEYDAPPVGSTYVTLDIDAKAGTFRGASACVLKEQDLKAFLDALELLAKGQRRDVTLVGGFSTHEDVRIEFSPSNSRGHIGVRVLLAEVPNLEPRDRLEAHFETEPAPVLRFLEELRRALRSRLVTTVGLYVAGGSAV